MNNITKPMTVVSLALSALVLAGCGTTTGETTAPAHSEKIEKTSFQGTWPFQADSGVLACVSQPTPDMVIFTPSGSDKTYAINGTARGWADKNGWGNQADIEQVAPGNDSGDVSSIIPAGLALCSDSK